MFKLRRDKIPDISRYKYKINEFKGIDALTDESLLDMNYCSYGYNISFKSGAIENGVGIDEAKFPISTDNYGQPLYVTLPVLKTASFIKLHYQKNDEDKVTLDRVFTLGSDGYVYYMSFSGTDWVKTQIYSPSKEVSFINYYFNGKNTLIICVKEGGMYTFLNNVFTYYDTPPLVYPCIHYERLFGVDGIDTIYFSSALNPTDFNVSNTGGGFIKLVDENGGKLLKLVSFNDYIYIFREHSVYRMTAYADPTDYRLIKVFETDQLILSKTIVQTDDKVLFMADNSLYSFNGYQAARIMQKLTPMIESFSTAFATYYRNKLYLSCRLKTKGEKVGDEKISTLYFNNGMIIADLQTGELSIFRGADITYLLPVVIKEANVLICTFGTLRRQYLGMIDEGGKFYGETLENLWCSPRTAFKSLDTVKRLRKIYINSLYPIKIKTKTSDTQVEKLVYGSKIPSFVSCNQVGEDFSIEITGIGDKLHVASMLLELDFTRRYYAN